MNTARGLKCFLGLILFISSLSGMAHAELEDIQRIRTPGFYLMKRDGTDTIPSLEPLTALDVDELKTLLAETPDPESYRVVAGIPSLLGQRELVREAKAALKGMDLKSDLKAMRWPDGTLVEAVLDFFPRASDWQRPLPEEIRTGHEMIFLGELGSFVMMGVMVYAKKLTPLLGLASTGLDLAQQAPFAYFLRAYSNYQRRQTVTAQTAQNILIALAFSQNFYYMFNHSVAPADRPMFWAAVLPGTIISTIWGYAGVAAFKWEGSTANRMSENAKRIFRSKILLIQQIPLSPIYIYSMSPFAKTLFPLQAFNHRLMDIKAGHLVVLAVGLGSAIALPYVDRIAARVSTWAEQPNRLGSCIRWLSGERANSAVDAAKL